MLLLYGMCKCLGEWNRTRASTDLKALLSDSSSLCQEKNSQDWNPCKFLQESSVTYLKEGGMYSGGRTGGRGWPDIATSIRCIARINSSAVSFPS